MGSYRRPFHSKESGMIELDFAIHRDSSLTDVVWHEVGEVSLRYDCFLGDIIFKVAGVDMSAQWGWVPILDFAICMRMIGDTLSLGRPDVFDFTESGVIIDFIPRGNEVVITPEYAPGASVVLMSEFQNAAEQMLSQVRARIEADHPDLRENPHYRNALRGYW